MKKFETEALRLTERLQRIRGTELSTQFNQYRRQINKMVNIKARGVKYRHLIDTKTGLPKTGNRAFVAYDADELCHKWLDERNIPSCDFFSHLKSR